jgi:phage gpG-like protein
MFIEVLGDRIVERKMTAMMRKRANMRAALLEVAEVVYSIEAQIFNAQGRRGGGSWRRDSDAWLKRKLEAGLDPRILHATLALRNAMTQQGAKHQIRKVTSQSLTMGTDLPYAAAQNRIRPFNRFTRADKAEMALVIRNSLVKAWRNG